MSNADWYRGQGWDGDTAREFARRLARARPSSRPQYRRIKAVYLLQSGDPSKHAAARDLLAQVLEDPETMRHERVLTLSMLGNHARQDGRLEDAERFLRASLDLIATNESGSSQMEEVWLADVLLNLGGPDRIAEAQRPLNTRAASPPLTLDAQFRMCLVGVRGSQAANDASRAVAWATQALELAAAKRSGLPSHPALGLVANDATTLRWLEQVVGKAPRTSSDG